MNMYFFQNVCDFFVARAQLNTDQSSYPYLENAKFTQSPQKSDSRHLPTVDRYCVKSKSNLFVSEYLNLRKYSYIANKKANFVIIKIFIRFKCLTLTLLYKLNSEYPVLTLEE